MYMKKEKTNLLQATNKKEGVETTSNCPYGVKKCPILQEIDQLKERCDLLEKMVETDPLTGLYNFRHLMTSLEKELDRSKRTGHPTSLIIIDLDHFKRVNDTFGHQAGNEILKWVSNIWRSNTRKIDIACRYGGEEFAIILPSTSLPGALQIAERLRSSLANNHLTLDDNKKVSITASFGVDTYLPKESITPSEFIKRADKYLLTAKETGRNKICFDKNQLRLSDTSISKEERKALGQFYPKKSDK